MRLHYIELANFRQFKGIQRMNLASNASKPVSLFFGANGSGKTTLLNAFTWALYGSLSEDVEVQDRMATDIVWRSAATGSVVTVSVELGFDHGGQAYRLIRQADLLKESDDQPGVLNPALILSTIDSSGMSSEVRAPQEMISSILPEGISRFFFFNGERIEKLVQKGSYSEIQQDIKALLNIKHVERAIEHLPKVSRKLSAAVKDRGGDVASELQGKIDEAEDEQQTHQDVLTSAERELETYRTERDAVIELLGKHESVSHIQRERDSAEDELSRARSDRESAKAGLGSHMATRGFLAFTDDIVAETAKVATSLYRKGALPAPLKREFVDKLLDDDQCICGAPLVTGSSSRQHVEEWRQRAGLQAVETAWQELNGKLPEMRSARDDLRATLTDLTSRVDDANENVNRLEVKVSELSGQLANSELEDVQALESKRVDLDRRIERCVSTASVARSRLQDLTARQDSLRKQLDQAELKDEHASKARDRADLVRGVQRALEEIREIRSAEMRERLEKELQTIFSGISVKPYIPRLNADFELSLYQDVDGVEMEVPKSTGENQILSVSFVAAVSKLAREIPSEGRAEGDASDGAGSYPIVMDAAFGSLDRNYQKEVARALARMAPQLVVLVSKSQGLGDVIKELRSHVSNLGVVVMNSSSLRNVSEELEIDGKNYNYILSGAESNYSLFEEIDS
ncbi:AAA family ATPase [Rhodococcus sp. NPDC057297]|uniref:AAA family ATPase n=1 Tax=Rhodococcus sp. NPDC057297 TaxID=3346090 RepID=UPI003625F05B